MRKIKESLQKKPRNTSFRGMGITKKYKWYVFFHPDCTVGPGFTPDQPQNCICGSRT